MNEATRAGINPLVLRQAAYYACLGVGEYQPKGYGQFNRVVVSEALPWTTDAANPMMSSLVLRVEFYVGTHRVRFVEFSMVPTGFGGEPVLRQI